MIFKLSFPVLLLISVGVSEGGRQRQAHRSALVKSPAKTKATDYLECEVEERLTYVHPEDQVTVVSPNWPGNYGRWEHCGWRFWTKWDATLVFFCDEIKLSNGDPLQVYQDIEDGAYKNQYSMKNGTLLFLHGYVNVEFSSSFFNGNAGFKCHVQSKTKETTPGPTTTVQGGQNLPAEDGADNSEPVPENPEPEVQPEGPTDEKPTTGEEHPENQDITNSGDESPVEPGKPTMEEGTPGAPSPEGGPVLQCSGIQSSIFVEPGKSVTLVSPRYPKTYPISTKCGWDLKSTLGVVLEVTCDVFSLNKKDFLLLAHGPRANQHKFRFDNAPQKRRFNKSRLMVRFSSNRYTVGAGFSCTVIAKN